MSLRNVTMVAVFAEGPLATNFVLSVGQAQAGGRAPGFLTVAAGDVDGLIEADKHYGESWYKRDGAGAFFMLARKWDRIEQRLGSLKNYNVLEAIRGDQRAEGIIDDIRDLRRYLMLVEAKALELGILPEEVEKGDKVAAGGNLFPKEQIQSAVVEALAEDEPNNLQKLEEELNEEVEPTSVRVFYQRRSDAEEWTRVPEGEDPSMAQTFAKRFNTVQEIPVRYYDGTGGLKPVYTSRPEPRAQELHPS